MVKMYMSEKDIVIPRGTVFYCRDGSEKKYIEGNYSAVIGLTKDSSGELVYGIDMSDPRIEEWFHECID